ncbi:MAG: hypothetical protein ACRDDH_00090 [Cetobacterium sp.]|uniref:hypothetical protein n=1 Tax=Cetobacterium sp. TaxID=2071632 RepID=UPI003EE74F0F
MELQFIENINNGNRLWFYMRLTYDAENFEEFEGEEMSSFLINSFRRFYTTIRSNVRDFLGIQSSILLRNGASFNISIERDFENVDDYIRYTCNHITGFNRGDYYNGLEGEWKMSGEDDFDTIDARSGVINIKVGFQMWSSINFPDLRYYEDFARELTEEEPQQDDQPGPFDVDTEEYQPEYELDTEPYEPEYEYDTENYFAEIQQEINRLEVEINSLLIQKERTTSLINDIERNNRIRRNRETDQILSNSKDNLNAINRRLTECRRLLRNMRRRLN